MSKIILSGSVGIGGTNLKSDILKVQVALNQRLHLIPGIQKLAEDRSLGENPAKSKTVAAIRVFQKKIVGMSIPDGVIDKKGRTIDKINSTGTPLGKLTTFPGTKFSYRKTNITLTTCFATLPKELRPAFKKHIKKIIREMHNLGIAFGAYKKYKAGYRSFQTQYDLKTKKSKKFITNAGPGESFHNYGLAVDLGVINWVDKNGKSYNTDFWLGSMDKISGYKGFSSKIWKKRNSSGLNKVYSLKREIIHLQGVTARTNGRSSLAKCLNKAATGSMFSYQRGPNKSRTYQCKISKKAKWVNIGTAEELWAGKVKNVTINEKKTIIKHMKKAESIAKTIII